MAKTEEGAGRYKVSYDVDRTLGLLEICDLTRGHPTLKPILDEALRELHGVAADIEESQKPEEPEAEPKEPGRAA